MARINCVILALVAVGTLTAVATGAARPDSEPKASVQTAIESLRAGRLKLAEKQALEVVTRGEKSAPAAAWRAWIVAAAARQRRGQFAAALGAYRKFLSSCSSSGLRLYALREIFKCQVAEKLAGPSQAPSLRLSEDQLDQLAAVDDDWQVARSTHFNIRTRNATLTRLLAVEAEAFLERIRSLLLGPRAYPHKVDLYVWVNREDFLAHAEAASQWSGAAFSFCVKDGVAVRRIDLTQLDESGRFAIAMLDRTLPHELCHLLLREYFGDAPYPLFLNEGLAMMAEWQVDNGRLLLAAAALAGEAKIPLQALVAYQRADLANPAVFYAEAFSFTEFLHGSLTSGQFRAFLEQVKNGCGVIEALQRALYLPQSEDFLATLQAAWENYAIAQGQYLRALASREQLSATLEN